MEENQALLGKEYDGRVRPQQRLRYSYQQQEQRSDRRGSSSEGSEGWWAESQSSCSSSSCSGSESVSSVEWETEVKENGELFFIESDHLEYPEEPGPERPASVEDKENVARAANDKKGKLTRWMRRRESKRVRPKLSFVNEESKTRARTNVTNKVTFRDVKEPSKEVVLHVETTISSSGDPSERLLGIGLQHQLEHQLVVSSVNSSGPAAEHKQVLLGHWLKSINNEDVTPQNIDSVLGSLPIPSKVTLKLEKTEELARKKEDPTTKKQASLSAIKSLTEKNEQLEAMMEAQAVGVVFVNLDTASAEKDDVLYSYPKKSTLNASRGSFVTLFHLLSEVNTGTNLCLSSTVQMRGRLTHVLYTPEGKGLLLIAVPDVRASIKEAMQITSDLVRCLMFNHQSLYRCFTHVDKEDLNHFFSLFFSRLLTSGFSADATQRAILESIPTQAQETCTPLFEDILPAATWVPLPKEAQLQIDDALNELEANDFENLREEGLETQRRYTIVGSCLYHKGYLLASHLPREDLLDVHCFCRQNGLLQLLRNQPVRSLVIWREVFPQSVERGLTSRKQSVYPIPTGRWFLLIVGQGSDMLVVILESGACCLKQDGSPGPAVWYVDEAEDTLRHIQKLGITSMTSQWLTDNIRAKTITPEDVFSGKSSRKKEPLLGFVRSLEGGPRSPGSSISPSSMGKQPSEVISILKRRGSHDKTSTSQQGDLSEDSASQATSNVSEVSDENAPILGRRAERGRTAAHVSDDSEDSDSDWESFRESNRQDNLSNGNDSVYLRGLYLEGVNDLIPTKLTTGADNVLFHYVHLDGSEGVLMSPTLNTRQMSASMRQILDNFRKSAQVIHSLLENNIRFKKSSQESAKSLINRSLIAVKEHGVLFECHAPDTEGRKPTSFNYWVVGRLFFTPQPREVYVCYHDDAPQNLVEIAFRLGLTAAG